MSIKNRINTCFIHLQDLKRAAEWYKTVFPIFFETDDVDAAHRELTGKGVRADEIEPFPEGMRGFHVHDPEGNMLLICSRPGA